MTDNRFTAWLRWYVFWSQPRRRWVVKLTVWKRTPRRVKDWLTDQLLPDEMLVTFAPCDEASL